MAELTVVFMDSGQGDCTLIVYPDKSLTLVDCGSIKNGAIVSKEISKALLRYVPANGNKINNFVLTHPDQDHYNLVKTLFKGAGGPTPVDHVYYGGDLSLYRNQVEKNATYKFLDEHEDCEPPPNSFGGAAPNAKLSRAGVNVYVLAANCTGNPKGDTGPIKNGNSIVLLLEYQGVKIFLMGDATADTESFIINQCAAAKLNARLTSTWQTALKMGHHGSAGSTGEAWVKAITPSAVFVSADTRTFSGTGMPAASHLANIVKWSGKVESKAIKHSYIQFDDSMASPDYETFQPKGPTTDQVCSTLYEIKYLTTKTFESTGGSWYYYVSDKKEISFGFTG